MDKEKFLKKFIVFSGWLEISIGFLMLFMEDLLTYFGFKTLGVFNLFAGVELLILGYMLSFSVRDLKKYLLIPVMSCIFRYAMMPVEYYGMVTIPPFLPMFLFGFIYDFASATLTLILLKQCGYFIPKSDPKK
jgi:hypothetical protein